MSAAGHGHGHGHGKVIVLGEHAAVYGHAAVAGAIDRGVDAIAVARPGPLTLAETGAFAVAVTAGDDHPVAAGERITQHVNGRGGDVVQRVAAEAARGTAEVAVTARIDGAGAVEIFAGQRGASRQVLVVVAASGVEIAEIGGRVVVV